MSTYYDLLEEKYMQQVIQFYEGIDFSSVEVIIREGVVYVIVDEVEVELKVLMV